MPLATLSVSQAYFSQEDGRFETFQWSFCQDLRPEEDVKLREKKEKRQQRGEMKWDISNTKVADYEVYSIYSWPTIQNETAQLLKRGFLQPHQTRR